MASAGTTNEFAAPGTYSVRLGDSFTSQGSKDASSYYSFKFNGRLDPTMDSRKATLQKLDDDSYAADWGPIEGGTDKTELNYDATPSKVQEMDCILLFDEATQTFTLQRPTLKFTVRKSRGSRKRKMVEPELPQPKAAKTKPAPAKRPAKRPTPTSAQVVEERRSSVDDFAKDIENNILELLDDDDDDDDDDDEAQSVTTAPSIPVPSSDTDTFEEVVHPHKRPSTDSPVAMNRKGKYKMASQPIRRLDDSPQPPPSTMSPVQRPQYAGKSISPAVIAANRAKKASVESSSESSSGSSSSGESGSSSSGESGSIRAAIPSTSTQHPACSRKFTIQLVPGNQGDPQ
ncbi:hypothetical protein BJV82DRAFT_95464 [Fennellomyces sp. T-0311]|nr:hypothetical protein BJV82DRAFT_95464 [Fennellomyces sp. T-0311]